MKNDFLPISKEDMKARGWDFVDFTYVIGDAYVDHYSFGPAVISRILEKNGYRVGIISSLTGRKKKALTFLADLASAFSYQPAIWTQW